ncbi:hypothetical protein CO110_10390 [Candidatus Desantisbacteria bacterium CG_4_9_14_3_um_filter_40_11]|uniref:Uncharacterized protein n=4 Tax=unclassified Candidatus Desantisiibacteriota TaxID=3106372 RepID=A0A2M7JCP9_9BACT|nr:MAG: hypothetical protein COX18_09150 [Candidatus Desantisbacteria bacterium CG23_combo_of_CG06-09_8_20_14_all_40_23]PIX17166.1 MAG: hypothetical protein COZ71_04780 [Candidatus Desantisbacteria bacterium CG_4_8_14_3_um_filter_40_12]PIY20122.1 MAG: hypothetical protein COZ13_01790 [Candidatus Desantisbacteria bacterium CG_4_10_14_3_um_filter_40_18]PJB28136.1 MAG: hypothetical protein CO110_10390 [Candidatus Desantisbacteria bacterium CG_4_9_14_3_um_filter_40_11]
MRRCILQKTLCLSGYRRRKKEIPIKYNLLSGKNITYTFDVADYSPDYQLIIDPVVYSTFVGGSNRDGGLSIALDSSNNAYITGWTGSSDFPLTPGAYDTSHNGENEDAFVFKLSLHTNPTYIGKDTNRRSRRQ